MRQMRNLTFRELDERTFDEFSAAHPQGNFQQNHLMGEVRKKSGLDVAYLGVFEDDELKAAALLVLHASKLSSFAEIHDGPLCDFHDTELTSFLFEQLRAYAHDHGSVQLSITPEAPYQIRDSFGRALPAAGPTSDDWPRDVPADSPVTADTAAFDAIVGCGFAHEGFDTTYNAIPRWRYVKDLTGIASEDELLASYSKNTKRDVRIARDSFVTIEQIGRDALADYHAVCELSCEKQGFDNRPLSYFELLYDTLGDAAEFKVAYIDMPAYLAEWEGKRDQLAATIERLEAKLEGMGEAQSKARKKAENQLRDAREKYESSLKRVAHAKTSIESQGERIPAAAALFVWHPRECIYLFSGSDQRHAQFCAATLIQHTMMCECVERGQTRYNFYGINGVFDDKSDPGRGLLEFKQGFNGYVEEMMGSFTLPVRPTAYALKQLAHKVLGR